jgi:hypothetical protein
MDPVADFDRAEYQRARFQHHVITQHRQSWTGTNVSGQTTAAACSGLGMQGATFTQAANQTNARGMGDEQAATQVRHGRYIGPGEHQAKVPTETRAQEGAPSVEMVREAMQPQAQIARMHNEQPGPLSGHGCEGVQNASPVGGHASAGLAPQDRRGDGGGGDNLHHITIPPSTCST